LTREARTGSLSAADPAFSGSYLHETGAELPSAHGALAGPTFEEWLRNETN
jgi:hypothetical protein